MSIHAESTVLENSTDHNDMEKGEKTDEQPFDLRPGDDIPNRKKFLLKQLGALVVILVVDVGLPLTIYYVLKMYIDILIALVLSGIPPLLLVLYTFIKKRKVDFLGCIFVLSFILSGVITLISGKEKKYQLRIGTVIHDDRLVITVFRQIGSPRVALLRDSAVTALVGLMFLITLIPVSTKWLTIRPLTFLLSQQMLSEMPPVSWIDRDGVKHSTSLMNWIWDHLREFRIYSYTLTALWGICLIGEFGARVGMVESNMTIDQIMLYGNVIVAVVVASLSLFSGICATKLQERAMKRGKEWTAENHFPEDA
ncbi:hypothetical protein DFQ28_009688 [Apophysomyces sp. BC1034]|nr:hypothetical protein DFQ30_009489 [Apophysomyces sp. BC1015]KAG0172512.1 hypothetical protein DFQ29_008331 [Apophysomyces sp. BC1021]KAG0185233.1 hypothetical protein DFQ28_009688 [Apophysomyces sp. BC1034]